MVSIKALVAGLAIFSTSAFARITNITATTTTVKAGQNITAFVQSEGYIQNYIDFSIIFGLSRPNYACGKCLGQELEYVNLFQNSSSFSYGQHGNGTYQVPVPSSTTPGDYLFVAAVPYLVGASGITDIKFFNTTVTVTNGTSS